MIDVDIQASVKDSSDERIVANINETMETNLYHIVPDENREAIFKALDDVYDAWGKLCHTIMNLRLVVGDIPNRAGDPCHLNGYAAKNYLYRKIDKLGKLVKSNSDFICDIKNGFDRYEGLEYPDECDY